MHNFFLSPKWKKKVLMSRPKNLWSFGKPETYNFVGLVKRSTVLSVDMVGRLVLMHVTLQVVTAVKHRAAHLTGESGSMVGRLVLMHVTLQAVTAVKHRAAHLTGESGSMVGRLVLMHVTLQAVTAVKHRAA